MRCVNDYIGPGALSLIAILGISMFSISPTNPAAALTFGDIINVSNTTTSSIASQIAVGQDGQIYVVWQESETGVDVNFALSLDPEDGFSNVADFAEDFTVRNGIRIAASNDRVFVVWFENDNEIYFTSSIVDSNGNVDFSVPTNLSNSTEDSRNPQIAAFGENVYVVWEEDVDGSSIPDIFFAVSLDDGESFSATLNLSNNTGSSRNPRITLSESGNVYVVWQDDTADPGNEQAILIKASANGGLSFGDVAPVNNPGGFSSSPSAVAYGADNLYLAWEDAAQDPEIFFAAGTLDSLDSSMTFGEFTNASNTTGFSTYAQMAVSGNGIIYVAWIDDVTGSNDVMIANSTDGGATFSSAIAISSDASISSGSFQLIILPSNQEDLYVVWRDANVGGNGDIFLAEITDNGHGIGNPINLSSNQGTSQRPVLGAFGENVYVAWQDNTSDNNEIFFLAISAASGGASSITVSSDDEAVKWGREIQVSGSTNGQDTDSVTIEWGDGSSTLGVSIEQGTWGPFTHSYNASNTGPNEIVAKLVDSGGTEIAASDPLEIAVLKHETILTIDNLSGAVLQGSNLTIVGTLTDADDNVGAQGRTITFEGTGASGLASAVTGSDGSYSVEGPSPNSAGTLWTLQAAFPGDSEYAASNSSIATFDTVSDNASQFTVPVGAPSDVELTGFNASIVFDNVDTEGTLFVFSCDTPSSPRYLSLGLCITISSTAGFPSGSFARLTVSYAGQILPDGHAEDEIDIFHEGPDGWVDITESRNIEQQIVTGRTSNFSKFVVAVAIHDDPQDGAIRKQVFVGHNDLVFNELSERTVSFDDSEYSIGSNVTVTVQDETKNTNESLMETVNVTLTSDRDSEGIIISLLETGIDTSIFDGTFTLGDASSTAERVLRANPGDTISGLYFSASRGPFRIIFNDIAESGLVELNTSPVDPTPGINIPDFDAISDAYEARLIDAQLGDNGEIQVIMSYVNVDLSNDEIISTDLFRVLQMDPASPPSGAFEWIDISEDPAVDENEKTVSGVTTSVGRFTIGHDVRESGPGGGGGGIPRPGTGVILLETAAVRAERSNDSNGNGGSGGSSGTSTSRPVPLGSDVEVIVNAGSQTVLVQFESVQSSTRSIKIEAQRIEDFEEIFEDVITVQDGGRQEKQGVVSLNGTRYSTVGTIFGIDGLGVNYDGKVDVTIPYNEEAVLSGSDTESNVRFLHYDEQQDKWEDATVSIDTGNNTVRGKVSSLSPVVAAVAGDGTFGETYFEFNPTGRIVIEDSGLGTNMIGAKQMLISSPITNVQRLPQTYTYIVQITDSNGVARSINWQTGTLERGQSIDLSASWMVEEEGTYTVQIFVWDDFDSPSALSNAISRQVSSS